MPHRRVIAAVTLALALAVGFIAAGAGYAPARGPATSPKPSNTPCPDAEAGVVAAWKKLQETENAAVEALDHGNARYHTGPGTIPIALTTDVEAAQRNLDRALKKKITACADLVPKAVCEGYERQLQADTRRYTSASIMLDAPLPPGASERAKRRRERIEAKLRGPMKATAREIAHLKRCEDTQEPADALPVSGAFHYNVTLTVTSTGDTFVVGPRTLGYSYVGGQASATFTMVFPVWFVVDNTAKTLDAEPYLPEKPNEITSTTGRLRSSDKGASGTNGFSLTALPPAGSPPGNPPVQTCTIPAGTPFTPIGSLDDSWGTGGANPRPYAARAMGFVLHAFNNTVTGMGTCTAASTPPTSYSLAPQAITVPGLTNTVTDTTDPSCPGPNTPMVQIPMTDLGEQHIVSTFDPGPFACQDAALSARYMAHMTDTITLDAFTQ